MMASAEDPLVVSDHDDGPEEELATDGRTLEHRREILETDETQDSTKPVEGFRIEEPATDDEP